MFPFKIKNQWTCCEPAFHSLVTPSVCYFFIHRFVSWTLLPADHVLQIVICLIEDNAMIHGHTQWFVPIFGNLNMAPPPTPRNAWGIWCLSYWILLFSIYVPPRCRPLAKMERLTNSSVCSHLLFHGCGRMIIRVQGAFFIPITFFSRRIIASHAIGIARKRRVKRSNECFRSGTNELLH
jgi:hypothetical protein